MALVLTRREGERLLIGDGVVVEVSYARRGAVRLAVSADPGVRVLREEVAPADHPAAARYPRLFRPEGER